MVCSQMFIRKRSFSGQYDVNKCVICQENKTDALEHKKQKGIQTLKERASQRQKIRDVRYYEAIDRREKLHTSDEVFCHRKCYSEFTHQKQIKNFEARAEGQKVILIFLLLKKILELSSNACQLSFR
jgi:hypothetical protein